MITDPFGNDVGLKMPRLSADVVTVSHQHNDHNNVGAVKGTSRRDKPFIIDAVGEYEVGGISVFGVRTYHDDKKGEERGENYVFSVLMDGVSVVHLGDLGHVLKDAKVDELNGVDVLLCPVGGVYTIGPKEAVEVIQAVEPSIVIPMHYKTKDHDAKVFGELSEVEKFVEALGLEAKREDSLSVSRSTLPEETELVVLESQAWFCGEFLRTPLDVCVLDGEWSGDVAMYLEMMKVKRDDILVKIEVNGRTWFKDDNEVEGWYE